MVTHNATKAYQSRYKAEVNRRRARQAAMLAGTVSVLAMLGACDSPQSSAPTPTTEQMLVYKTLDECKAAQADDKLCETAFAEAWGWQGQQTGYSEKGRCEAEYGEGHCESRATASGGSWFVPLMAGVMLSNRMNNMSYDSYRRERERDGHSGAYPVYVNRRGDVSTYAGSGMRPLGYSLTSSGLPSRMDVEADPSGRGYVAKGTSDSRYRASSRGGFGKSSTMRGGCCG
ncbi:DUF1190 domain-containing protein [Asticcacaulis sp. YBE204]|uniref:DUF1190 domain-containing protein n=1 Tax=Asticcacaulis sp. YBE204 TaxID=1282363 RepID=UPI0003C3E5C8|nr:DUF1190 domain-containing protein [Asticcacaulis sp. YBE204]ESQ78295.1 hypothetical protein AEYBE204_14080 [Asticcacaulis sp. YBE204]